MKAHSQTLNVLTGTIDDRTKAGTPEEVFAKLHDYYARHKSYLTQATETVVVLTLGKVVEFRRRQQRTDTDPELPARKHGPAFGALQAQMMEALRGSMRSMFVVLLVSIAHLPVPRAVASLSEILRQEVQAMNLHNVRAVLQQIGPGAMLTLMHLTQISRPVIQQAAMKKIPSAFMSLFRHTKRCYHYRAVDGGNDAGYATDAGSSNRVPPSGEADNH